MHCTYDICTKDSCQGDLFGLSKCEGWHKLGRKTGRAPIRGQQIVWKIQAEFELLKRKKENVQKF